MVDRRRSDGVGHFFSVRPSLPSGPWHAAFSRLGERRDRVGDNLHGDARRDLHLGETRRRSRCSSPMRPAFVMTRSPFFSEARACSPSSAAATSGRRRGRRSPASSGASAASRQSAAATLAAPPAGAPSPAPRRAGAPSAGRSERGAESLERRGEDTVRLPEETRREGPGRPGWDTAWRPARQPQAKPGRSSSAAARSRCGDASFVSWRSGNPTFAPASSAEPQFREVVRLSDGGTASRRRAAREPPRSAERARRRGLDVPVGRPLLDVAAEVLHAEGAGAARVGADARRTRRAALARLLVDQRDRALLHAAHAPHGKGTANVPRAANSHSRSLGRRLPANRQ